mmetsp:Transcript_5344/g.16841  ORF Transcript_5344/g.16841 Transcript_5344/m.16841 type:complete len:240 (+) Transcript_5344:1044-1763(+)
MSRDIFLKMTGALMTSPRMSEHGKRSTRPTTTMMNRPGRVSSTSTTTKCTEGTNGRASMTTPSRRTTMTSLAIIGHPMRTRMRSYPLRDFPLTQKRIGFARSIRKRKTLSIQPSVPLTRQTSCSSAISDPTTVSFLSRANASLGLPAASFRTSSAHLIRRRNRAAQHSARGRVSGGMTATRTIPSLSLVAARIAGRRAVDARLWRMCSAQPTTQSLALTSRRFAIMSLCLALRQHAPRR